MKKFSPLLIFIGLFSNLATCSAFTDVDEQNIFKTAIYFLQQKGIVQGYADKTYKPYNFLNRAELLKIVIAAKYGIQNINGEKCFQDVDPNSWQAPYVCFAKNIGIVKGYADGTFRSDQKITVAEALKITMVTYGFSYNETQNPWYSDLMLKAQEHQFIPYQISTGDQILHRGEMADLITRVIKYLDGTLENYLEGIEPQTIDDTEFESLTSTDSKGTSSVLLLLDKNLVDQDLMSAFRTFVADLKNESYHVIVKVNNFTTPEEVREYLQQQFSTQNPKVEGVILIGNIPYAHLVIDDTNIPGGSIRSAATYEFYQDLDGVFSKTNSDFPNAYSSHTGNTNSEIWVTILPWYVDKSSTIEKITYYLNKNHTYRTTETKTNGFIEIQEMLKANSQADYDQLINSYLKPTGDYASLPANHTFEIVNYFVDNIIDKPDVMAGYANLSIENRYNIFNLAAHGNENGAGGLTKIWLNNNILAPFILFIGGCNAGNIDALSPPILVEAIYNSNSRSVFAQGTSTFSGGLGKNTDGFYVSNILRELFNDKNLGQAFIEHLNTPLIYPWSDSKELHHGILILIGDGTLKLKY